MPLTLERHGPVALVTLQRPDKRNALSIELRELLAETFATLAADQQLGCVVLTGAGSAFCAGMDRSQFGGDRAHRERMVASSIASMRAVGRCPKPLIAAVNGPALAGGFALALLCDMLLAAESARFGFVEVELGIPAAYAAARAALPGPLARELALTGRLLDAHEAHARGVVAEVVPDERLLPRALELARRLADQPRGAATQTKRRILRERETLFEPLFAEEERALREALLVHVS